MALDKGSRLGPYEIIGRLGSGGMGVVYRARDPRLERDVAIKVLHDDVAANPDRLRRFEREARAAGALNHPNVVAVYDVGIAFDAPYVVTELLDGETLRDRLRAGALSPRQALEVTLQIAAGLAAAHERGIVHRDLKPENLFLTRDGRVKILDFGVAKLRPHGPGADAEAATISPETMPGAIIGTIGYLSPEQARGEDTDARSDIFALGAVLYEMIAGVPAFSARSAGEALGAVLRDDPPALGPDTPPGVDRIVRRCLRKDRGQRFTSARDLAFALEASSAEAGRPSAGGRAARSVAVLPFNDLAGNPDNAHIGLGLADATITELALVRALVVRPTAAILRYQGRAVDPGQAARELDVDAVVDGNFQRVRQRLRLTVQLVSADGRSLWATKVDAALTDVFKMQDDVSRRIAEALEIQLTAGDEQRLVHAARTAPSERAYELYLRGRLSLFRGRLTSVQAAIDAFEQACAADPTFVPAWAALADAYARMAFEHAPERDWYERAQAMCARALELDPTLPDARYVRGRLAWNPRAGFDHETALREAGLALAANPALMAARYLLGLVLFHVGLVDEAETAFADALAADPADVYARMHVTTCWVHHGRFGEAVSRAEQDLRLAADRWSSTNLIMALLRLGRLEEAAAAIRRLGRENPDYPQSSSLAAVLAACQGDGGGARRAIERIVQAPHDLGHFHHAQYDAACAFARLGDHDAGMEWLRAAAGNGYPCPTFFAVDPFLDPVRDRADFARLMQELEGGRARYQNLYADLRHRLTAP